MLRFQPSGAVFKNCLKQALILKLCVQLLYSIVAALNNLFVQSINIVAFPLATSAAAKETLGSSSMSVVKCSGFVDLCLRNRCEA